MKNTNKSTQKPKVIATTYSKKFENFQDMINELKSLHPMIGEEIFSYEDTTPCDALRDINEWFKNNTPDIIEGENLRNHISLSAAKVNVKTSKYFSFGWKLKYNREGFVEELEAMVTTLEKEGVTTHKDIASMKDTVTENGWEVVEFPVKKNKK